MHNNDNNNSNHDNNHTYYYYYYYYYYHYYHYVGADAVLEDGARVGDPPVRRPMALTPSIV